MKTRLFITYFSVGHLFWNFAQTMAVMLLCSVQNFKMMHQFKWMLWMMGFSSWDLSLQGWIDSVQHSQYHGCWCPGDFRRQDINTHGIDYVQQLSSCLTWGRISTTCALSMWRKDMKCKYVFWFPLKNLAHKGLRWVSYIEISYTAKPPRTQRIQLCLLVTPEEQTFLATTCGNRGHYNENF